MSKSDVRDCLYPSWKEVKSALLEAEEIISGRLSFEAQSKSIRINDKAFECRAKIEHLRQGDLVAASLKNNAIQELVLLAPNINSTKFELAANQQTLHQWSDFKDLVSRFFKSQGFLHIDTPSIVVSPGTEPSLEVFETTLIHGRSRQKMFLPTSPELHLKKILAKGISPIFEIKNCFRNNEVSLTHAAEFWMIEWYRNFAGLEDIQSDLHKLLVHINSEIQKFPKIQFTIKSMEDLFKEKLDFSLNPNTSIQELQALASKVGITTHDNDWDDLFYRIFVDKIENDLKDYPFLLLKDYPPSQAALARKNKKGWGERFELYIHGIEICNAFDELNDPIEQRLRFKKDLEQKEKWGRSPVGIDEDFLQALEAGMPPAAGIALGLERLFMAFYGIDDIKKVKAF